MRTLSLPYYMLLVSSQERERCNNICHDERMKVVSIFTCYTHRHLMIETHGV